MDENNSQRDGQRWVDGGRKTKPFDLMGFLRRRSLPILVLGGLFSLIANLLFLPFVKPVYQTDALLLLDPTKEPTLTGRERDIIPGNLGDYTRTMVSRIMSYDVVFDALTQVPEEELPSFLQPSSAVERNTFRLMSRIKVAEVPRTYLVSAKITASEPGHLGTLLNAILESFLQKIHREQEHMYERRLVYLREERANIQKRIEQHRARLLALADTVESKAFLHEAYTVHFSKVEQIQRLYWEAEALRAEKEGLLEKARLDQQQLLALDLQPFADERVADNFGINRIEQWTYEQLQGMRAGIDGLTPENPDRKYVEMRMEAMNGYLGEYKQRVNVETIRNLREKRLFELEAEVLRAQSTFSAASNTSTVLHRELDLARDEASAISSAIFQSSDISFAISQLRDRLNALDTRIDDCELEAKTPPRISIDKRAANPTRPATTNQKVLFMLAVALGFGFVLAVYIGFDFLDNRIRSPREIELALGAPGPDPVALYVSSVASTVDFARATIDAPDHRSVHAIRDLAVRLNFERERHGGRVFVLAGLEPGCGCTTLTVNVAHALAALCPDVWLVETNLERPGLRATLNMPSGPGLESALNRPPPWTDCWKLEPVRRLRVLAAEGGTRPASHARLPDLLSEARKSAGVVLIDAGCILTDELAYYSAIHADAVILVAREDVSLYRHLRRAVDLMVQAGVPALTAVLNHAQPLWAQQVVDRLQDTLAVFSRFHRAVNARLKRIWRTRRS